MQSSNFVNAHRENKRQEPGLVRCGKTDSTGDPRSAKWTIRIQRGERNAVDMYVDLATKSAFLVAYGAALAVAFWALEKAVRRS
jgi:hypothetical protein